MTGFIIFIVKLLVNTILSITGAKISIDILHEIRLAIISKGSFSKIFSLACGFFATIAVGFWLNASYYMQLKNGVIYAANTGVCHIFTCQKLQPPPPPPPGSESDLVANVGDRVFFDSDSATLSPSAIATLNRIEAWLIKYPNVSVSVAGNTDDTADDSGGPDVSKLENFLMGNMRAQAVANYLMEQYSPYGVIAPSRLEITSYGQGCPIAKGNDQKSLQQNKNVIISVQGSNPQNCNADDWSDIDNFMVIFGDGGFKLTPRLKEIIDENAKGNASYTFIVSGYTDTVGTPEANQALSQSRADAVADQLVADGVPTSNIYVNAYGETNLLVPTGPGVREPQNNRVTVEAGTIWSPGPGY